MWHFISIYCFLFFLHQLSILISSHNSKCILWRNISELQMSIQTIFHNSGYTSRSCDFIYDSCIFISPLQKKWFHRFFNLDFEMASWNFSICIAFIFCISVSQSWWEGRRMKTSARPPNRSWHHHHSSSAN